MEIFYSFELYPIGMIRSYKSKAIAMREAKRQVKRFDAKMGGCSHVYADVYETTFNPYKKNCISTIEID